MDDNYLNVDIRMGSGLDQGNQLEIGNRMDIRLVLAGLAIILMILIHLFFIGFVRGANALEFPLFTKKDNPNMFWFFVCLIFILLSVLIILCWKSISVIPAH